MREATTTVGIYLSEEYARRIAAMLFAAGLRNPAVFRHGDATLGLTEGAWAVVVPTIEYDRAQEIVEHYRLRTPTRS
jgi:hypothetical protein